MGANYRMTEIQAALANVGLERLPAQAKEREAMLGYMEESLSEVPGVRLLRRDERHTTRSFYRFIFAVEPETFGAEHKEVCAALDAEGIPCWSGYQAMHHYELFQPKLSKLPVPSAFPEKFVFSDLSLPEAERACEHEAVWLDEAVFRAGRQGVDDAVGALLKIQANAAELRTAAQAWREQEER
jgi:dTDP-4-amino-4,6-dideoxygalactose transaminase